jgi:hypothetical protein
MESPVRRACERNGQTRAFADKPIYDLIRHPLAGQRNAIVMSLVPSAKLHGHDPWAYLRRCPRLPTQLNIRIDELLPHNWQRSSAAAWRPSQSADAHPRRPSPPIAPRNPTSSTSGAMRCISPSPKLFAHVNAVSIRISENEASQPEIRVTEGLDDLDLVFF